MKQSNAEYLRKKREKYHSNLEENRKKDRERYKRNKKTISERKKIWYAKNKNKVRKQKSTTNSTRYNNLIKVCKKQGVNTEFKSGDEIMEWLFQSKHLDKDGNLRCHLSNKIITREYQSEFFERYSIDRIGLNAGGIKWGDYIGDNMKPCLWFYNNLREQSGMTVAEFKKFIHLERMENLGLEVDYKKITKTIEKDNKPSVIKKMKNWIMKTLFNK